MSDFKQILTGSDYESLANLRFTLRKFMEFSTSAAQDEGLPSQQHQALLAIKGHPGSEPMTVGMLANRLIIAPHTATELVDRLSRSGFLVRKSDPADKRRQALELTDKAERTMGRLSSVHMTEIREMAPELIVLLKRFQKT